MPRFFRALAAASLVLTLAACDSTGTDPVVPSPPATVDPQPVALPLAVGNEWTYQTVRTRFENGGSTVLTVDTLDASVLRVTEALDIGGETWYRLVGTEEMLTFFRGRTVYANRADGLYARAADGTGRATRQIAFPAEAGTQFGISYWIGSIDHPDGLSTDSDVTLKVTDLPVQIGGDAYDGFLYTVAPQRFRIETSRYEIDPRSRPFHNVIVPDVGYATFEAGFYGTLDVPFLSLASASRFALQSFTLVTTPA